MSLGRSFTTRNRQQKVVRASATPPQPIPSAILTQALAQVLALQKMGSFRKTYLSHDSSSRTRTFATEYRRPAPHFPVVMLSLSKHLCRSSFPFKAERRSPSLSSPLYQRTKTARV